MPSESIVDGECGPVQRVYCKTPRYRKDSVHLCPSLLFSMKVLCNISKNNQCVNNQRKLTRKRGRIWNEFLYCRWTKGLLFTSNPPTALVEMSGAIERLLEENNLLKVGYHLTFWWYPYFQWEGISEGYQIRDKHFNGWRRGSQRQLRFRGDERSAEDLVVVKVMMKRIMKEINANAHAEVDMELFTIYLRCSLNGMKFSRMCSSIRNSGRLPITLLSCLYNSI